MRVHQLTRGTSWEDRALTDQMRRAAVSVASNIAEGNERGGDREVCRFLYIAKGSAAELSTQLEIASEIGLLPLDDAAFPLNECEEISRMLHALVRGRRGSFSPLASRLSSL